MKKSILVYVWLSLIIFACNSASNFDDRNLNVHQDLKSNLIEYFQTLADQGKFNGAVLIEKQGQTILYDVFKMPSNVKTLQVQKEDQFDIHSISKLMARACILQLENEGRLNRRDKLDAYLPNFPNGKLISIQQLMDHQSGLPRRFMTEYPNVTDLSPLEIVNLISKESLEFEPGLDRLYSNLGYELLYYIISIISKKPFVQYANELFFVPLDMQNTGAHFHFSTKNLMRPVQNHENDDGEIIAVPSIEKRALNQARIYSSLKDLLKFGTMVKHDSLQKQLANSDGIIGASGGGDGILSHVRVSLKSDYEFAMFSNYDEIPFGNILETVDKIMTQQSYTLPVVRHRVAVDVDMKKIKPYLGKYKVPAFNNDEFEFRVDNGSVVFYQNGERNGFLFAENDSTFFAEPSSEDIFVFRQSKEGDFDLIFKHKGMDIKGFK